MLIGEPFSLLHQPPDRIEQWRRVVLVRRAAPSRRSLSPAFSLLPVAPLPHRPLMVISSRCPIHPYEIIDEHH